MDSSSSFAELITTLDRYLPEIEEGLEFFRLGRELLPGIICKTVTVLTNSREVFFQPEAAAAEDIWIRMLPDTHTADDESPKVILKCTRSLYDTLWGLAYINKETDQCGALKFIEHYADRPGVKVVMDHSRYKDLLEHEKREAAKRSTAAERVIASSAAIAFEQSDNESESSFVNEL
jgi:hypothetical protein